MRNCLLCANPIQHQIHWTSMFMRNDEQLCCLTCYDNLEKIKEPFCPICSKKTNVEICSDCIYWQDYYGGKNPLLKNYSLFAYNDFIKDIINRWKYRGDYVLGSIFRPYVEQMYNNHVKHVLEEDFVVIPVPLSKEREYERGFNQAEQLASFITKDYMKHGLKRKHTEKQSKKTRIERLQMKNPFRVNKIREAKYTLIIDDIYTTGTTVHRMASLLKKYGYKNIYSFTLIRG